MRPTKNNSKLGGIRTARGMTQQELSDTSGVNKQMINFYETGKNDINKASGEKLYKLSKALGCTIEDLLEIDRI